MAQWQGGNDQPFSLARPLGLEGTEMVLLSPTQLPIWAGKMWEPAVPRHQAAVCNVTVLSSK